MLRIAVVILATLALLAALASVGLASDTYWIEALRLYTGSVGNSPMDTAQKMGVRPGATDGYDSSYDSSKPAMAMPPTVYLFWYRASWGGSGGNNYTADYRATLTAVMTWEDLRSQVNPNASLVLTWAAAGTAYEMPTNYIVTLYDEGTSSNPTGGTPYVMKGSGAVTEFAYSENLGETHYFHIKVDPGGTPNPPPTCSITFTPASPTTGQSVSFDSHATDSNGTVTGVAWTFGDGGTGTGLTTTHTYTTAGAKTVNATATDNGGATGTCSTSVTVVNVPPTCNITFTPASPATGQSVSFDSHAADSDGTVASVAWTFGDGSNGTGATTTHTYTTAGAKTVNCTVTDNGGATGTCSTSVTVVGGDQTPPVVSGLSPADGATLTGAIDIAATAADPESGVTKVEFFLDDHPIGTDTSSPYGLAGLDTMAYSNGKHAIVTIATNGAGLTTWSYVVVTFNNPLTGRPTFSFSATKVSYTGGVLTLTFRVTNTSAVTAQAVAINSFTLVGTTASGAAVNITATPVIGSFPKTLGDMIGGASQAFDVQATIPGSVVSVKRYMFVGQFTLPTGGTFYF